MYIKEESSAYEHAKCFLLVILTNAIILLNAKVYGLIPLHRL
jgi:hypothetical protein